jgi:SAM-dependent methyltransferase
MASKGYRVIGIDAAYGLARQARAAGAIVVTGDALRLPVKDATLDFVYTVGVLHHLPGRTAQQAACREIARVLRPGGLLIVHETNPRNPLFRFYMGYVFPLLKTIDTGIEWWLEPEFWAAIPRLRLLNLEYFTFLPDFIPALLLPGFRALEQRLESSFLKPYAVHYAAILRKTA